MDLSFKDIKKTLQNSINKFNLSISPLLSNTNFTQVAIDDFYKKLKDIDAQYDILINNSSIPQEEKAQIFQEIQKCRENFSILQKQQSVHSEQHYKKTIKRPISLPAKLYKIFSNIISSKKSNKDSNNTHISKPIANIDHVIIGDSNEKLSITDLKRTNNNKFYNDNDYSEIFNDNPIHFYRIERAKRMPNNIFLKYINELYGYLNIEKLNISSNENVSNLNQSKLNESIRYTNGVQYRLLPLWKIENNLLDTFGNIGYLKDHVTDGYIPKYTENRNLEKKLNEHYEKAFIERKDNTDIKIFKVGTIDIIKNKKIIKQLDQYIIEQQPHIDLSNSSSDNEFVSGVHKRYSNSKKLIVYGNIDFEKIYNEDIAYISTVANDLLSDSNLNSKYIGSVEPYYGAYLVNKISDISNIFDFKEKSR